MSTTLKDIRSRMVPASVKKDSGIDSQYLEPASYDKKARKAFKLDLDDMDTVDHEEMVNSSDAFKAQDMVKKNTKAPLREYFGGQPTNSISASSDKVNRAYEDEALDLFEEIATLIEELEGEPHSYFWREVTSHLKNARDTLLQNSLSEEFLDETFKAGKFKLRDGSHVKLTNEDVKVLNSAITSTPNQTKFMKDVTENSKEFNKFLTFAHNVNEDFEAVIDNFLNEATDEQLKSVAVNGADLNEVWEHTKNGALAGAIIGKNVGSVVGTVYGGTVGATAGLAIGAAKHAPKLKSLVNKWNKKKELEPVSEDCNEKESILGTSTPAMDSVPKKKKKEDLQEISSKTLNSYIDGAMHDQMSARMHGDTGRLGKDNKTFKTSAEIDKHIDKRERGMFAAERALARKKSTNDLYSKLGLNKLVKEEDLQEVNQRAFSRITGIKPIGRTTQSHQFANSIGGDSSNYKKLDQVAKDESVTKKALDIIKKKVT